jgi:N-acetylglucosamine-6-phosphate deacetylase
LSPQRFITLALQTQEKSLYPTLLHLLRPLSTPGAATLLGWHAEGPFLQMAKRGAHAPALIQPARAGFRAFEAVYGAANLADAEDWLMGDGAPGVRIVTAAPEIEGVMESVPELAKRGVVFSIGHRCVPVPVPSLAGDSPRRASSPPSIATTDIATAAVHHGARLITHLFNAMPQLHHRDPSIIGLLGSSPFLSSRFAAHPAPLPPARAPSKPTSPVLNAEALNELDTPPQTPLLAAAGRNAPPPLSLEAPKDKAKDGRRDAKEGRTKREKIPFERPFYEMIVDGVHSHPNSVRLAYSSFPEGCILITDGTDQFILRTRRRLTAQ